MMDQATGMDPNALMQRVRRMATLDTTVFDEVRGEAASTIPALIVAAASILLYALGGFLWYLFSDYDYNTGEFFTKSVIVGGILTFALWAILVVGLTYLVLTQMFRHTVDIQQLFRVMGFGLVPMSLGLLGFFPEIGFGVSLAALMFAFGSSVFAAQAATDAPPGRVLAAVGIGFLAWAIVLALFVGDDPYGTGVFVIFEV